LKSESPAGKLDKPVEKCDYWGMNEDLRITASLARLNVNEAELEAALPAFSEMLSYFAAMQAAPGNEGAFGGGIAGLSFTADSARQRVSPLPSTRKGRLTYEADSARAAHFRPDAPPEPEDLTGTMLDNAGERDGRFIVIPNVL
jgi:aspartyl-tRNA(Asn)/glutamyl-tRNA(Gln) amidotransferase subunit C